MSNKATAAVTSALNHHDKDYFALTSDLVQFVTYACCSNRSYDNIWLLTLEASITQFITVPYVEHELADMNEQMKRRIQHFDLEKVLDERNVARIDAKNKNDLRRQIMRVYKRYHPNPIVVYSDAFEVYSFITRWRYRSWLPWTVGEVVFFQGIDNKSDGTTIDRHLVLCRIIGKDQRARYRYQWYFTDRHKFEGAFSSDFNSPNDFTSRWT